MQTALIAGMADISCGVLSSTGSIGPGNDNMTITCSGNNTFDLEDYLKLPTHGTWDWDTSGVITNGTYTGGGTTCTYDGSSWNCTP